MDGENSHGVTGKSMKESSRMISETGKGLTDTRVARWENFYGKTEKLCIDFIVNNNSSIGAGIR